MRIFKNTGNNALMDTIHGGTTYVLCSRAEGGVAHGTLLLKSVPTRGEAEAISELAKMSETPLVLGEVEEVSFAEPSGELEDAGLSADGKVFRPAWVEKEAMKELGYDLVENADGCLKYVSGKGATSGGHPLWKGKRTVGFNTTYDPKSRVVFCGIREDGDTRNVFYGVIDTGANFRKILELVR